MSRSKVTSVGKSAHCCLVLFYCVCADGFTDGVAWSVCHDLWPSKWLNQSRCHLDGGLGWAQETMYLIGVHNPPWEWAIFSGKGRPIVKYRELWALQKWLTDQDAVWGVDDLGGPRGPRSRWDPDSPWEGAILRGKRGSPLYGLSAVSYVKRHNWSRCCLGVDSGGSKDACVRLGYIGVTWWIWLNRPCLAAMQPFCQIILTTHLSYFYSAV